MAGMYKDPMTFGTLTSLLNARSTHTLAAGVLLGSNVWGSLIQGIIAFKSLPRQQFGHLQAKTFPVYFSVTSYGSAALFANWLYYHPGVARAMLDSNLIRNKNVVNAWILAAGCLATSLLNWLVILPWTSNLMYQRHKLERAEGKSYTDPNVSDEMKALTAKFGSAHGVSSLLNLAFLAALSLHTAWVATYGF